MIWSQEELQEKWKKIQGFLYSLLYSHMNTALFVHYLRGVCRSGINYWTTCRSWKESNYTCTKHLKTTNTISNGMNHFSYNLSRQPFYNHSNARHKRTEVVNRIDIQSSFLLTIYSLLDKSYLKNSRKSRGDVQRKW